MTIKYKNLQELQRRKGSLKRELQQKEDVLTFKDTKKSLSILTNGLTDRFLTEKKVLKKDKEGEVTMHKKLSFNAAPVLQNDTLQSAVRMGIVGLVAGYAQRNMRSKSWKKKAIGFGMVYLLPILIRHGLQYLEERKK